MVVEAWIFPTFPELLGGIVLKNLRTPRVFRFHSWLEITNGKQAIPAGELRGLHGQTALHSSMRITLWIWMDS